MNATERHVRIGAACVLLCLGLLGGAWLLFGAALLAPPAAPALTVALPLNPGAGAFFVAEHEHLYARHGVTPRFARHLIGKEALQSMLDGKADLALVGDIPFMLAVLRGERIATVGTVFQSRRSMALLARGASGVRSGADLAGKTIGTVAGTSAEYFLDALLAAHGIARGQVKVLELAPQELGAALRAGRVDAVTAWAPLLAQLQKEFAAQGVTVYGGDLFVSRFLIAGRADFIAANPEALRRLLAALDESNNLIRDHPVLAQELIAQAVGLDPARLGQAFNPGDYALGLDQSLLLALGEQTRWAMARGVITPAAVPNFLDHVRQRPLEAARPGAVRIIR